jgi:hypothetical protein
MKTLICLATASLFLTPTLTPNARAQNLPTEIIGSHYHDPTEKAAESLSRGLKAKRKAEGESDPEKRRKLFERAKKELSLSVGYEPNNFDSLLALGQVYLALDAAQPGQQACARAIGLKPGNSEAQSCLDRASEIVLASAKRPAEPPH